MQKEIFLTKQKLVQHITILNEVSKPSDLLQNLETNTVELNNDQRY